MGRKPVCTASTAVARTHPDGVRTHARRRAAARDDERIDLAADQPWREIRAEETGSVFLHQEPVARPHVETRIDRDAVAAGLKRRDALLLERPDAGVTEVGLVVHDGGEDDRDTALMRDPEQRGDRRHLGIEIGPEHHGGVGERLGPVDDQERGPLAEPDPQPEPALTKEFLVLLTAGHVVSPCEFALVSRKRCSAIADAERWRLGGRRPPWRRTADAGPRCRLKVTGVPGLQRAPLPCCAAPGTWAEFVDRPFTACW